MERARLGRFLSIDLGNAICGNLVVENVGITLK